MGRFWLQNIILAPSNSKAVWNTQYSEVELQLGPFENITFLGPDPLSVVRYAKKKRVQVHANKETVTKITRQRRMKRQWQWQWQWAVGSGQWAVGSGQWAVGSGQWAVGSGKWAVAHHMKMKQLKGGATVGSLCTKRLSIFQVLHDCTFYYCVFAINTSLLLSYLLYSHNIIVWAKKYDLYKTSR
jgi:hypothetical protein